MIRTRGSYAQPRPYTPRSPRIRYLEREILYLLVTVRTDSSNRLIGLKLALRDFSKLGTYKFHFNHLWEQRTYHIARQSALLN